LNASHNVSELLVNLLSRRYEKQSYEKEAKPVYTVTTEWHGDIEWAYKIEATHTSERFKVGFREIEIGGDIDAAVASTKAELTIETFAAYCKAKEAEMVKRAADYAAARAKPAPVVTTRTVDLSQSPCSIASRTVKAKRKMSAHLETLIAQATGGAKKTPASPKAPTTARKDDGIKDAWNESDVSWFW